MPDCPYCDTESQTEGELTAHLDDSHSREELSRVDRKRVETHAAGSGARSRLGRVVPDGRLSRRAALAGAGTALAGIGVGIGRRMASSHISIQDWQGLAEIGGATGSLSDDYRLQNDLNGNTAGYSMYAGPTANGGDGFDPIGSSGSQFTGVFDGNGNTISGLTIDRAATEDVGLFGSIGGSGSVTDLSLASVDMNVPDVSNSTFPDVGGLTAENDGTIQNVSVSGSVTNHYSRNGGLVGTNTGTVTGSSSSVDVEQTGGNNENGGLVGRNEGTVTESYATGNVTGGSLVGGLIGRNGFGNLNRSGTVERCYATSDVDSGFEVGGLIGTHEDGTVKDTYAIGNVTGSGFYIGGLLGQIETDATVETSYAAGTVTGGSNVGGLIGRNFFNGTITDCYWDKDATGQTTSVGGTDRTTDQMQGTEATNNMSFDFNNTWAAVVAGQEINPIPDSDGYPVLGALDAEQQFSAQGIGLPTAIEVDGADNTTIDNVTIANDN